tara:strand:+ start:64 stop:351 length:288 start_codon:yes stop_codon:yes gene_type:complete
MAKIEKPILETEEECLAGLDERQKLIVNAQTGEQKYVPLDDDDKAFFTKRAKTREASHNALFDGINAREDLKESARAKLVAGEKLTEEEAKLIVL